MQRAQHNQTSWNLLRRRSCQAVNSRLQVRTEITQLLAMKVLELVQSDYIPLTHQLLDQRGNIRQALYPPLQTEGFQVAIAGRHHPNRIRVGYLDIQSLLLA